MTNLNDALLMKKLILEFSKCIIVIFQLVHDFTHLASKWVFFVLTVLIKNLRIFHPIQSKFCMNHCTTGLMNKVTLDLSRYGWKSLVGDTT